MSYISLIGKKFVKLLVIKKLWPAKNRTMLWECLCDCGTKCTVAANHLKEGHTRSCGCLQKDVARSRSKNLLNKRFGRLLVIEKLDKRYHRWVVWKCLCKCGNIVEIPSASLLIKHTRACGCYQFDCVWKGGIASEPYCSVWLNKEFRKSILERDGYQCQNPNCLGISKRLCLHHIDYNKKNCNPNNLIILCNSCNVSANYNRSCRTNWYRIIMSKKYNYKY